MITSSTLPEHGSNLQCMPTDGIGALLNKFRLFTTSPILEIYWNLKYLVEILESSWNLIAPPGNFYVIDQ